MIILFLGTTEGDVVHPTECMYQLLEQVRHRKVNIICNDCTAMVTTLVLEVTCFCFHRFFLSQITPFDLEDFKPTLL